MSILVHCPHCGKAANAPDEYAGKKVRCAHCKKTFVAADANDDEAILDVEHVEVPRQTYASLPSPIENDDEYEERRSRFRCPFCGTSMPPRTKSSMSTGGIIMFIFLLIICFPICFLAFFMQDKTKACSECGVTLG